MISAKPIHKIEHVKGPTKLFQYFDDNKSFDFDWVFRAQPYGKDLETTLERHCRNSGFDPIEDIVDIENGLTAQFIRIYDGDDRQLVQKDKLYCLSLMRHYGAPNRLLDVTYSKHVALYFRARKRV